jgi:hypothetical protein
MRLKQWKSQVGIRCIIIKFNLLTLWFMNTKPIPGVFSVIDSFAIQIRNGFYLIGKMSVGEIKSTWFGIPLKN